MIQSSPLPPVFISEHSVVSTRSPRVRPYKRGFCELEMASFLFVVGRSAEFSCRPVSGAGQVLATGVFMRELAQPFNHYDNLLLRLR
jgi:hypothetical protein